VVRSDTDEPHGRDGDELKERIDRHREDDESPEAFIDELVSVYETEGAFPRKGYSGSLSSRAVAAVPAVATRGAGGRERANEPNICRHS